jgi:hypothetical protein
MNTSLEAYETSQAQIKRLLKKIEAGLERHDKEASRDRAGHHWGYVGDLLDIQEILTDISDRLHLDGEYAPTPTHEIINGMGKKVKVTVPR